MIELNKLNGKEWLLFSKSIWEGIYTPPSEKTEHPAQFPVALVSRLLNIFTSEKDIVLDPFVGSGSTLVACKENNRHGIGVDLNEKYVQITKDRLKQELLMGSLEQLVICGDSRKLGEFKELKDFLKKRNKETIDFMVTSPPYWDVLHERHRKTVLSKDRHPEKYSELKDDLGNIEQYDEFLSPLKQVFAEVYKLLGYKKYCVVVVMDIRKGSKVYPFHSHVISLMEEIGYSYQDLIIWNRDREYNFLRPMGYPTTFIVNKVHEYLLIFRKNGIQITLEDI
jgi:DNA modification methylase